MKKLRLYLETSLFGFFFDELERNREKTEAVRKLFSRIKEGIFDGFVSRLVIEELSDSPPGIAEDLINLVDNHGIKLFLEDEIEARALADKYIDEGILPEMYVDDAFHVALATIGEFDVLVTMNFAHIANEINARKFRAMNYREGYTRELSIRTPMEVIVHEY